MKTVRRISPWLCLALALGACSPSDLLNAFVPGDGYVLQEGIAYGDSARQALDVRGNGIGVLRCIVQDLIGSQAQNQTPSF